MPFITTELCKTPFEVNSETYIYDLYLQKPELFEKHENEQIQPVAVYYNYELVSLAEQTAVDGHLKLVFPDTQIGADVYRQSLIFLVGMAFTNLIKDQCIQLSHSVGTAFYFKIFDETNK